MNMDDGQAAGRPRDGSIDIAVIEATRSLLVERGYAGFGMGMIASRAGTTRQAIYRRWANKALVVLDTVFAETTADIPDIGELRTELEMATGALAKQFNDPVARSAVGGLLADLSADPDLHARVRAGLLEAEHARVRAVLERAAVREEINRDTDLGAVVEAIGGAIVYRTCFMGEEADGAFVEAVVDLAVKGTRKEPE
ncbi:MAG: TetR/AcrR family transcriptional regulator [Actinomycetia bacterium]|nr:TetR/AcrR family transcriptional regulator [Actinomycetes bacterium]